MQRVVCLHQRSPVVSGIIAVDRDRTFWITRSDRPLPSEHRIDYS
ncbi:MAG: hypothetical protein P2A85_29425 (plasmid) [Microcoleus anatoxicus]